MEITTIETFNNRILTVFVRFGRIPNAYLWCPICNQPSTLMDGFDSFHYEIRSDISNGVFFTHSYILRPHVEMSFRPTDTDSAEALDAFVEVMRESIREQFTIQLPPATRALHEILAFWRIGNRPDSTNLTDILAHWFLMDSFLP